MSVVETVLRGLDTTTVIVFLVIFLIGYYWMTTPRNLPPGPIGLPLVGQMISVLRAEDGFLGCLKKWRQQYGDVYTVRLGNEYLVVINSYEVLQSVFVKQADVFSGRPKELYVVKKVSDAYGSGLFTSDGSKWKNLRRLTLMGLRDMGIGTKSLEQRVQEEARAIIELFEKSEGQPMLVGQLLPKFSANIICSIVLGNRFDYEDPAFIQLTTVANALLATPVAFAPVNFIPFLKFFPSVAKNVQEIMGIHSTLDSILESMLKEHEETYDPGEVRDFVDLYIKTREETKDSRVYSALNMRIVILDLLIAGTDTTASTTYWMLLYLIAHPDIQKRCQQDVDSEWLTEFQTLALAHIRITHVCFLRMIIGQGRLVTMDDRQSLPYIMAVIAETMRIAPVGAVGAPHLSQNWGKVEGYTVPPNTIIMSNILEIHHDPKCWPEPDAFRPERFLNECGQFRAPTENYVPFSAGPRICLGESLANMELFILSVTLIQSFTFTMAEGHKPDLKGQLGVTYSPRPQHVQAIRR